MAGAIATRRETLKSAAAASALTVMLAGCGGRSETLSSVEDLASLDAISTARAVRDGEITALESINAAIDRAEAINPKINAIVTAYYDTAREIAAQSGDGLWHGVPSFIKDLNNVIGQRTAYGSTAFKNNIATSQSDFVDAYFNLGMISLGKSATPEFGLTATTETALAGATRNPWNADHSAGGSSGGAAALVASRVVPVAHASDGGGSIRIPASCCGLVGLKPSSFRFPEPERAPGRAVRISEHGIVSRTVRDTAAFFAMMETDAERPKVGLIERASPVRRKIALAIQPAAGTDVHPDVVAAMRDAADRLSDAGHEIVEIAPPFSSAVGQDFFVYWASAAAATVGGWEQRAGRAARYDEFEAWTFGLVDYARAYEKTLPRAVERLQRFKDDWRAAFDDFDILLTPVLAAPPAPVGYLSPSAGFPLQFDRIIEYAPYTYFANVAGAPSISMPMGESSTGLPVGVMASARQGDDGLLIELAYEMEEATGWTSRRPALTA